MRGLDVGTDFLTLMQFGSSVLLQSFRTHTSCPVSYLFPSLHSGFMEGGVLLAA